MYRDHGDEIVIEPKICPVCGEPAKYQLGATDNWICAEHYPAYRRGYYDAMAAVQRFAEGRQ